MKARCVECKERPAVYWDKSFCMDCYTNLLKSKTEDKHEPRETVSNAGCA